jgi:hypothetical protein
MTAPSLGIPRAAGSSHRLRQTPTSPRQSPALKVVQFPTFALDSATRRNYPQVYAFGEALVSSLSGRHTRLHPVLPFLLFFSCSLLGFAGASTADEHCGGSSEPICFIRRMLLSTDGADGPTAAASDSVTVIGKAFDRWVASQKDGRLPANWTNALGSRLEPLLDYGLGLVPDTVCASTPHSWCRDPSCIQWAVSSGPSRRAPQGCPTTIDKTVADALRRGIEPFCRQDTTCVPVAQDRLQARLIFDAVAPQIVSDLPSLISDCVKPRTDLDFQVASRSCFTNLVSSHLSRGAATLRAVAAGTTFLDFEKRGFVQDPEGAVSKAMRAMPSRGVEGAWPSLKAIEAAEALRDALLSATVPNSADKLLIDTAVADQASAVSRQGDVLNVAAAPLPQISRKNCSTEPLQSLRLSWRDWCYQRNESTGIVGARIIFDGCTSDAAASKPCRSSARIVLLAQTQVLLPQTQSPAASEVIELETGLSLVSVALGNNGKVMLDGAAFDTSFRITDNYAALKRLVSQIGGSFVEGDIVSINLSDKITPIKITVTPKVASLGLVLPNQVIVIDENGATFNSLLPENLAAAVEPLMSQAKVCIFLSGKCLKPLNAKPVTSLWKVGVLAVDVEVKSFVRIRSKLSKGQFEFDACHF